MTTTAKERQEIIARLTRAGVSYDHAHQLRRIAMALHRWAELECGGHNDYGAWAIERDEKTDLPYMVLHHYRRGHGQDTITKTRIADREKGALKRLGSIMQAYPDYLTYHQTDPRGCSLYLVAKQDLPEGGELDQYYNRGIAIY